MSLEQKYVFIFLVLVFSISGFVLMKKLYFYICGSAGRFVLPLELTRPSHCLTDELWPRRPHFQSEWFTDWVISVRVFVCLWEKVRETKSDRTDVSWHGTVNPFRHEPGNYWCKRKLLICVLSAINSIEHQTQSVVRLSVLSLSPSHKKARHQHKKNSMCYLVHDFPMLCHSSAVTSAYCFLLVAAQQLGKKKILCDLWRRGGWKLPTFSSGRWSTL